MEEHFRVGIVNTASGIIFALLSLPLLKRKIKMNDWYGFRISAAFKSEENWYNINEYGARKLIRWSLLTLTSGLLAFFVRMDDSGIAPLLWVCIPITVSAVVPIAQTVLYARKL